MSTQKGGFMKFNPKRLLDTDKKLSPKLWAIFGVAIILVIIILSVCFRSKEDRQIFFSMDTTVTIKSWGGNSDKYKKIVTELDGLLDRNDKESEIYKLNQNGKISASDYTVEVLKIAKDFCQNNPEIDVTSGELSDLWKVNSGGNLPTDEEVSQVLGQIGIENLEINEDVVALKGGKVDLGCVAKGYACDVLWAEFEKNDEECAIASFGSSSALYGKKPDGEPFSVGVSDPESKGENVGILELSECFVSTSGGYERYFEVDGKRYSHIMDLGTGRPVETDILSVTVVGESGSETDMLSTLLYIKGVSELEEYFSRSDIKLLVIDNEKNIYISESLAGDFQLKNSDYSVVVLG